MSGRKDELSVISLFTGAMGLDLGLEKSGFRVRVAVECNRFAGETIKSNRPRLPIIERKIEEIPTTEILKVAGLKKGEATLVIGGPSCQPFSTAGQRGSVADPRGKAFQQFLRVVKEARPRFFIMENVRGVLSAAVRHRPLNQRGPGWPPLQKDEELGSAFKLILKELKQTGYSIIFDVLNTADFGVPQMRERVVFIGSRDGEPLSMPSKTHSKTPIKGRQPWLTLRDAIGNLKKHKPTYHPLTPSKKKYLKLIPAGRNWRSLPKRLQKEALGGAFKSWGGRCGFLRRLSWANCPPALTTAPDGRATMMCHPTRLRPLSTEEYAALQQFPPKWKFAGSLHQQYIQIGNAVPVGLGCALGKAILSTMSVRKRRVVKKGHITCADSALLKRMINRPRTIMNPPRMRKIKSVKAARRWATSRGADRTDLLKLLTPSIQPEIGSQVSHSRQQIKRRAA